MQHIGLMMVRNEIDVIEKYMDHILQWINLILVLDDSDDGTYEYLEKQPQVKYIVKQKTLYFDERPNDGMRQCLLSYAQRNYGYGGWFHLLHPDEFFWDNPIAIAEEAEAQGVEQVNSHSMYFFYHTSQKDIPIKELGWPVWYSPGTIEERQFKNKPGLIYHAMQDHKCTPHGLNGSLLLFAPIIRHYPLRSPEQALARARDRLATQFQEQYHWVVEGLFRDCHPKLRDRGARQFDGKSFYEYEVKESFLEYKRARLRALSQEIGDCERNGVPYIT